MGNERIVFSEYLPEFEFYLVNMIDKKAVTGQMVNAKAVTLTIMAIVAISLVIVFLITRRMTQSLRVLVEQMSSIPTSGFDHHVDVANSSYEVKELGNAFNFMLDALHDYVDRLMETQKQQRNAELAALQMQINPHFCIIRWLRSNFWCSRATRKKPRVRLTRSYRSCKIRSAIFTPPSLCGRNSRRSSIMCILIMCDTERKSASITLWSRIAWIITCPSSFFSLLLRMHSSTHSTSRRGKNSDHDCRSGRPACV